MTADELTIRMIEALGSPDFGERLIGALKDYVPVEAGLILLYSRDTPPMILYSDMETRKWNSDLDAYTGGMYLLDPFYLVAVEDEGSGVFRLLDVAPDGFYDSEYYESYYGASSIGDEINLLIPLEPGTTVAVSMSRHRQSAPFTEGDTDAIRGIAPTIFAAVRKHYRDLCRVDSTSGGTEIHRALTAAISRFGSSVLTPRECDVARLILRGHSSKSTAPRLGISPDTVKLHRRNLYAKLGIGSQTELFSLFIDSVSSAKDPLQDPLLEYDRRP